jgi:hypothetical protein
MPPVNQLLVTFQPTSYPLAVGSIAATGRINQLCYPLRTNQPQRAQLRRTIDDLFRFAARAMRRTKLFHHPGSHVLANEVPYKRKTNMLPSFGSSSPPGGAVFVASMLRRLAQSIPNAHRTDWTGITVPSIRRRQAATTATTPCRGSEKRLSRAKRSQWVSASKARRRMVSGHDRSDQA